MTTIIARAIVGLAVAILLYPEAGSGQPSPLDHEFFMLEPGQSLEDSLRSIHVSTKRSPAASEEFYDDYHFIEGRIASIDSLPRALFDWCYSEDGQLKRTWRGQLFVGIEVERGIYGDVEEGYFEAVARITTLGNRRAHLEHKTHSFEVGSRFAGLLILRSDFWHGENVLHGASAFMTVTASGIELLTEDEHDRLIGLFEQSGRILRDGADLMHSSK